MGKEKYKSLLKSKEIERWYGDVCSGSKITGDVYLRRLGSFCESMKTDPFQVIKMKDKDMADLITDYVRKLEREGHVQGGEKKEFSGGYVKSSIKGVKSWLAFNGIKLPRRIKIANAEETPSLDNEQVPSQDELLKIFNAGDSRARSACALVALSGLRIGVLGNYTGSDGLRLGDIPELRIHGGSIKFEKIPAKIVIRRTLSKAGNAYLSFLGPEGCGYLEAYLGERISEGEELSSLSPVITPSKLGLRNQFPFIAPTNIGDIMRTAIKSAGLNVRPYALRAYFDTRLLLAQDERLVIRDYRTFWMGHKGDIEHTYTVNKGKLPADLVEKMREAYARSCKFLETKRRTLAEEDTLRQFKEILLRSKGYSKSEIEKAGLLDLSNEEILKRLAERTGGKAEFNGNSQKVIGISEIEAYVSRGFEFVASIPGNKVIVRFPG